MFLAINEQLVHVTAQLVLPGQHIRDDLLILVQSGLVLLNVALVGDVVGLDAVEQMSH